MEVQRGVKKGRKRKSLLKNAKKYGKRGKFGRGTHLDEDIYKYFVHVLELVEKNKFETEEEKGSYYV
jgi:nucleolar protein 9